MLKKIITVFFSLGPLLVQAPVNGQEFERTILHEGYQTLIEGQTSKDSGSCVVITIPKEETTPCYQYSVTQSTGTLNFNYSIPCGNKSDLCTVKIVTPAVGDSTEKYGEHLYYVFEIIASDLYQGENFTEIKMSGSCLLETNNQSALCFVGRGSNRAVYGMFSR